MTEMSEACSNEVCFGSIFDIFCAFSLTKGQQKRKTLCLWSRDRSIEGSIGQYQAEKLAGKLVVSTNNVKMNPLHNSVGLMTFTLHIVKYLIVMTRYKI